MLTGVNDSARETKFVGGAYKLVEGSHLVATDKNKILMPLSSIAGVGIETAKLVELAYKKYSDVLFDKTREELEELKIEKDDKNVKAFGKKFLDGYFGVQE